MQGAVKRSEGWRRSARGDASVSAHLLTWLERGGIRLPAASRPASSYSPSLSTVGVPSLLFLLLLASLAAATLLSVVRRVKLSLLRKLLR